MGYAQADAEGYAPRCAEQKERSSAVQIGKSMNANKPGGAKKKATL
jgi:hypothetical protein